MSFFEPLPHECAEAILPTSFLSLRPDLFVAPPLPPASPPYVPSYSFFTSAVTAAYQQFPVLLSTARLLALLLCPLLAAACVLLLLHRGFPVRAAGAATAVGAACSALLLCDSMYVYEVTALPGIAAACAVAAASARAAGGVGRVASASLLAALLAAGLRPFFAGTHDGPGYPGGVYYHGANGRVASIVGRWIGGAGGTAPPGTPLDYDAGGRTAYAIGGDLRTALPFLWNGDGPAVTYERRWIASADPDDGEPEALALDFSFPQGGHRPDRPLYLVLHGISGGSDEPFTREFCARANAVNSTAAVINARGLHDTHVRGKNLFHGARIEDTDAAARVLRELVGPAGVLAAVGFSMGGIVVSNYVARSGTDCPLDFAVDVGGGLDMREQLTFERGRRLWQPFVAEGLREKVLAKTWRRIGDRLGEDGILQLLRAADVQTIDRIGIVAYNSHKFDSIEDYYAQMSAMGDRVPGKNDGRIADVAVPLLVLHALDDPLITHRTMTGTGGRPGDVVRTGTGNVVLGLTESGGHIGWPLGNTPWKEGWKYMNGAAIGFVEAGAAEIAVEREESVGQC